MNEYVKMWKNYFNFSGRATRKDYWMALLFNILVSIVLGIVAAILGSIGSYLIMIYCVAIIIPSLSLLIRRLHDINKAWTWIFITLIPLVGYIVMLVFLCTASVNEGNRYGNLTE